jgi:DNA invertase Pin-like site-specific DNA recombinase
MTLAYSYIRFSTPIQKLGRSYDRQMEACVAWCAKHGVELAENTFYDEGRSGYLGEHLGERGQLKRFLDEVEAGKIARGSYLIIESLDRLSRQSVNEALGLFIRILNADINIVTLMDDEKVYRKNFTPQELIMSVFVMARANEESVTKSKRGKDDWQDKFAKARATGKPVGRQVVKWLDLVDREDGQGKVYVENPERCDIVERVFKECIAGKGFVAISKGLNLDGIPAFRGGTWSSASVDDLLKNRCVLGEWTPNDGKGTIEGYFPAVIDSETWGLAELAMEDRRFGKVTKQAAIYQVWQQVGKCGICGSTMITLNKPKTTKGMDDAAAAKVRSKPYRYLSCSGKLKGICAKSVNVRLEDGEAVFKELLIKVGALGLIQSDAAEVTREIEALDVLIVRQRQLLKQHTAAATKHPGVGAIYGLMAAADAEIKRLGTEKAVLELKHAEQSIAQSDKTWLLANLPLQEEDERRQANALLRRLGVTVRIRGGKEPVYIAVQRGKDFLQLMTRDDGVMVVPLNKEQREKFAVQDATGEDLAQVDDWLAEVGMFTARTISR